MTTDHKALIARLDAAARIIEAAFDARDAAALIREAARALEALAWQKIETAPKDGRWLHLFGDGNGFMECDFVGYFGIRKGWPDDQPAWRMSFDYGRSIQCEPTHWQLLPAAPAKP